MKHIATLAIAAGLFASVTAAHAANPSFTTIDNPGDPTFNQLLGIDNAGVIAGYFGSGMAGHPNQAYTIAPPYTQFAPSNVPGSSQTQVTALNNTGTKTGFFTATNTGADSDFGFISWSDRGVERLLLVNNPGTGGSTLVNQVLGVNDSNNAVGFYVDGYGVSHGYSYSVASAKFMPVTINGAMSVTATGINAGNLICGAYVNAKGRTYGFTKPMGSGVTVSFQTPGSTNTQLLGINKQGIAVGFFADANNIDHGLVYNPANGNWVQVDDPNGVGGTVINGLNDKGQAVGFYTDAAGNVHGMLINGIPTQL